jgi:mono/diheme cytochrome c family protein
MKQFILGIFMGALVLLLSVVAYLQLGMANVAADAPTPAWVTRWMFSATHASIRRATPRALRNPIPVTNETLIAGGKLYLNDCVGCHGTPGKAPSDFGATFYPPAPQLGRAQTTYSEPEIYWIAKHGIRRTGMSEQASSYSDEHLWQLAAFIGHITTLPPQVRSALEPRAGH